MTDDLDFHSAWENVIFDCLPRELEHKARFSLAMEIADKSTDLLAERGLKIVGRPESHEINPIYADTWFDEQPCCPGAPEPTGGETDV